MGRNWPGDPPARPDASFGLCATLLPHGYPQAMWIIVRSACAARTWRQLLRRDSRKRANWKCEKNAHESRRRGLTNPSPGLPGRAGFAQRPGAGQGFRQGQSSFPGPCRKYLISKEVMAAVRTASEDLQWRPDAPERPSTGTRPQPCPQALWTIRIPARLTDT